ncbi:MAG: hypothetical protein LBJ00_01475 [Planctomycetaceae bacterium]|nr:hypothetical protein [Planctomycetaceae bacterium]
MIGNRKLLLLLGVAASKFSGKALTFGDVKILDISVKKSWNSSRVSEVLARVSSRLGKPPQYVVSDGSSVLCKAIRVTLVMFIF